MAKTSARQNPTTSPRRVLRVGLVLAGKILEERTIHSRATVSVGRSTRNTFCLDAPGLGRSWPVLSPHAGGYALHVAPGMDVRLSLVDRIVTLAELRDSGRAQTVGDRLVVPLGEAVRGKVTIGELTLLFQLVAAQDGPRPQLPPSVRGRLLDRIDPVMAAIAFFSFVLHGGGVGLVYAMDTPRTLERQEPTRQYVTRVLPRPGPVEPVVGDQPIASATPVAGPPEPAPGKSAPRPAPFDPEAAAREQAKAKGLITIIGAAGKNGRGPADLTDDKNLSGNLTDGLIKAREQGLALAANGPPSGGTRDLATGQVGAGSGPDVTGPSDIGRGARPKVGEGEIKTVADIGQPRIDDDGGLDAEDIYAKIKGSYAGLLQKCYQDGLKSNGSLKGRVDVTFTVGAMGNVTSVSVDGFDSGVDACIQDQARRWRFGKPPSGEATFQFPFTFRAGS